MAAKRRSTPEHLLCGHVDSYDVIFKLLRRLLIPSTCWHTEQFKVHGDQILQSKNASETCTGTNDHPVIVTTLVMRPCFLIYTDFLG